MTLETIVQIVTIAGAVATAFSFAVLRPLNAAIARLEKTIEQVGEQISRVEERWHEIDKKVAEVDQRARSAHKRLDTFAEFCRRTHEKEMPADVYAAITRSRRDDE